MFVPIILKKSLEREKDAYQQQALSSEGFMMCMVK
jgi:hypothetical protein